MSKDLTLPSNYEYDTDKLEVGDLINITFKCVNPKKSADNALAKVIDRSGKWVLVAIDEFYGGHYDGPECSKGNCWYISSLTNGLFPELKWIKLNDELFFDDIFNYINENVDYLNKPKGLIKEGYQIPYDVSDFKSGDRIHITGDFDEVSFDNFATIIATTNDIDNPYEDEDGPAILVRIDEPNEHYDSLHSGGYVSPEVRAKCAGNCWWIWMYQFSPAYPDRDGYRVKHSENLIVRLDDNFPNAYDVISSLYESTDLKHYIYPGIEVGDEVITSFRYNYNGVFADNKLATVLDIDSDTGWILLKIKAWRHGHDGEYLKGRGCGSDDCFYVKAGDLFSKMVIKPIESLGLPNAYDVISSLYESEDLDWAMNMASDISKSIITPGQYYRINGKIAQFPFDDTIDLYIKEVNDDEVIYDVISVGGSNWSAKHEKTNLKLASKLVNDKYWYPIGKEESLFNKKRMDESEDLDWAMNMAKNIEKNLADLSMIPRKANKYYNVILFDKPGITEGTVRSVVNYINNETSWKSKLNGQDIKYIIESYIKEGTCYINLKPNNYGNSVSYGINESTFAFLYNMDFSSPGVKIIRPYSYDETINESEDELDWAMDMAKNIDDSQLKLLEIPRKLNGYYNVILFDKPGITEETIEEIINYIQKNTEWVIDIPENISISTHRNYGRPGKRPPYINLKPDGTVSYGSGEGIFRAANKVSFNDPQVKIIRPYSYDETINESEDFDWAMDMVDTVNLNMASIPTKDDYKNYVILFDKPGITRETIEEIVNYIEKYTEWYFTNRNQSIDEIFQDYREGKRSPYIRLFPGPELNIGDSEETFNAITNLNFNHPQVKIIRPYSYDETINESEDFDWAMDMAKDIEKNLTNFSMIPTKVNGYYNVILFDKPGITRETIEEIVNYIEKYTEWKFSDSPKTANTIYGYYKNDHNMGTYINLRPERNGSIRASYGSGHDVFRNVNKVSFNDPQVKIIRPYSYDETINESEDLDGSNKA